MQETMKNLILENAHIMFRNFSGMETKYNKAGNRNFCVKIPSPEQAQKLSDEGWNVRILAPRSPDEEPIHYISVAVSYKFRPPIVKLISRRGLTQLDEDDIAMLDQADIANIDMSLRPYHWETPQGSGVKAYLKTMYVTLNEDEFEGKYAEEEFPEE